MSESYTSTVRNWMHQTAISIKTVIVWFFGPASIWNDGPLWIATTENRSYLLLFYLDNSDHAEKQKLIDDAMYKLEHGEKDKRKSKAAIPGLVQIKVRIFAKHWNVRDLMEPWDGYNHARICHSLLKIWMEFPWIIYWWDQLVDLYNLTKCPLNSIKTGRLTSSQK